jgi:hypothetical protein
VSADDQRLNEGNTSTGIKNLLHEFNLAVMIPAGNPTQIYPKPTGNYPQQILKQAYGSSKNFLHEFNPAVMIAAVTPPPIHPKPIQNYQQQILTQSYGTNNHASPAPNRCPTRFSVIPTERPKAVGIPKTRKYSDTNTIYKATKEPENTAQLPNRYPLIEPLAHIKLTPPSPPSLSLYRNLTLTFPNEAQPYNRHIITSYSNVPNSGNTLLLSSTLVILKSMTMYSQIYPKYTDHSPHTPPSCSNYLYYPMLYPLIKSYQQLNPHNTLFNTYGIDHDSTASPHSTIYGSTYHSQNCKQTQFYFKFNYPTHPSLHKSTRTYIQLNYPGKLSSPCSNPDRFLLWKINSSLSTQVERPKAGRVLKTSKYPDANTLSVPTPPRIAFNTTTYPLQPPPPHIHTPTIRLRPLSSHTST